ncbi:hypothetical protein QFZ63_001345 [Streptomyces sp. B3I7]|nr:hypothetical protein [Streptomyces sp. B3I7]
MEPVVDTMPIGELLDERRHLRDVAHWMLGSGIVAEHVTDEAYREWYALSEHQRDRIGAPRAWLTRVVGSISLGWLALSDRDGGPQGPMGVGSRGPSDPAPADGLGALWAGALDALTPAERAARVLNDAFGSAAGGPVSTAGPAGRDRPGPDTEASDRARHSLRARAARPTPPRRGRTGRRRTAGVRRRGRGPSGHPAGPRRRRVLRRRRQGPHTDPASRRRPAGRPESPDPAGPAPAHHCAHPSRQRAHGSRRTLRRPGRRRGLPRPGRLTRRTGMGRPQPRQVALLEPPPRLTCPVPRPTHRVSGSLRRRGPPRTGDGCGTAGKRRSWPD